MPKMLKTWRRDKAFTIRRLADEAGVSPTTVFRIEHKQVKPTPEVIRKLAAALKVEPSDISF